MDWGVSGLEVDINTNGDASCCGYDSKTFLLRLGSLIFTAHMYVPMPQIYILTNKFICFKG